MNDTHSTITVLIVLLLIASGVAMVSKQVPVPYTLALVVVGLVITPMHFLPTIHISPDLILLIFLPALLFEAAWNLKLERLKANLVPILSLAVLGVIFSVGMIGLILHFGAGLWRWAGWWALWPPSLLLTLHRAGLKSAVESSRSRAARSNDIWRGDV